MIDFLNFLFDPRISFSLVIFIFFLILKFYKIITSLKFSVLLGILILIYFIISCFNENFKKIITKPDNVAIAFMLFLVIFFTYLGLKKASLNDVAKKLENNGGTKSNPKAIEKVHVWPELVFRELIVMILVTVFLTVWSILLDAPLEEPANPTKTPNPAKAPWYFLGLQEMLVYYDPWIAGVLLPLLIIFGLMAIPYIDTNPKGNGYYTLSERKFAVTTFLFGFLILWVFLIIVGTFLRGPGWNFFSPYEKWDTYKVEPLTNVNLSEILGLNPKSHWIIRELPGFFLLILYFFGLPLILAILKRDFYKSLGFLRFVITIVLLLIMLALPIKMFLTWTINLKYLIVTPWFNI